MNSLSLTRGNALAHTLHSYLHFKALKVGFVAVLFMCLAHCLLCLATYYRLKYFMGKTTHLV